MALELRELTKAYLTIDTVTLWTEKKRNVAADNVVVASVVAAWFFTFWT